MTVAWVFYPTIATIMCTYFCRDKSPKLNLNYKIKRNLVPTIPLHEGNIALINATSACLGCILVWSSYDLKTAVSIPIGKRDIATILTGKRLLKSQMKLCKQVTIVSWEIGTGFHRGSWQWIPLLIEQITRNTFGGNAQCFLETPSGGSENGKNISHTSSYADRYWTQNWTRVSEKQVPRNVLQLGTNTTGR